MGLSRFCIQDKNFQPVSLVGLRNLTEGSITKAFSKQRGPYKSYLYTPPMVVLFET